MMMGENFDLCFNTLDRWDSQGIFCLVGITAARSVAVLAHRAVRRECPLTSGRRKVKTRKNLP